MAEIKLRGISRAWGSFVGVDAIDLEVRDKEFMVFLGPSGCGKTTTMRMIAGLEEPTAGEIEIASRFACGAFPRPIMTAWCERRPRWLNSETISTANRGLFPAASASAPPSRVPSFANHKSS